MVVHSRSTLSFYEISLILMACHGAWAKLELPRWSQYTWQCIPSANSAMGRASRFQRKWIPLVLDSQNRVDSYRGWQIGSIHRTTTIHKYSTLSQLLSAKQRRSYGHYSNKSISHKYCTSQSLLLLTFTHYICLTDIEPEMMLGQAQESTLVTAANEVASPSSLSSFIFSVYAIPNSCSLCFTPNSSSHALLEAPDESSFMIWGVSGSSVCMVDLSTRI